MAPVEIIAMLAEKGVRLALGDDGQLKVSAPKGAITATDKELLVANKAAIIELLAATKVSDSSDNKIPHADRSEALPLSFSQERLWFLNELEPGTPVYNVPSAIGLKGELNPDKLQQAFDALIQRHEALRTTFTASHGLPVQVIHECLPNPLQLIQAPGISEQDLQNRLTGLTLAPFDLQQGPLVRLHIIQAGPQDYTLLIVIHHIISDGQAMAVLMNELAALYNGEQLNELPIQFADYAVWQRNELNDAKTAAENTFWKQKLAGAPTVLELPGDRPRPATPSNKGAWYRHELPRDLQEQLHEFAKNNNSTLYMVLLAAFDVLIARYANVDDLLVGSASAGRTRTELEGLIGYLVNMLIMRADLSEDPSFAELLAQVRDYTVDVHQHQSMPFEKLIDELQPERQMSQSPLFQVVFGLQSREQEEAQFNGLSTHSIIADPGTAKFDLHLLIDERSDGLFGWFEYATDLFDEATIARMAKHYETLLRSALANPQTKVSELRLTDDAERTALLDMQCGDEQSFAADNCIHELVEQQAEQHPDNIALSCGDDTLTYRQLNERANQLAHALIKAGVTPDTLVGLSLERSNELVVGILGILKAGGAYVPLDPNYPEDRLAYMLDDSQAAVLVTHSQQTPPAFTGQLLCIDTLPDSLSTANPQTAVTPDNLAYVIYTSGSTGKPKGVLIEHRNVIRLMRGTEHWFGFNESDVWTLFHSYAFDFTVWELWGALAYGGKLVVVPWLVSRSPEDFYALLEKENVTVLNQTPSAFAELVRIDSARSTSDLSLRYVVFGGEALDPQSLRPWFERHGDNTPQLINMYGITETTVHVTWRPITLADCEQHRSVIGEPIPDLSVYVLDQALQPVPTGIPGEMFVGGAGLARGYLNRAELTAERFIDNPIKPGTKLYKTGDLARYLPDGELEYLGRIDEQVKLRGFRIELGEIEAALLSQESISQSVVLLREDTQGDKRLVAYVVAKPGHTADAEALKVALHDSLPDYMVPSAILILDEFPLTANGKTDRRALPAPTWESTVEYVAPRNDVEAKLVDIWLEILSGGHDTDMQVGIHDDFFALGGHSLMATRVIARVRDALNTDVPLKLLFDEPTVAGFAAQLSGVKVEESAPVPVLSRDEALPLSFAQQRLWFLHHMQPDSSLFNVPWAMRLTGELHTDALQLAVNQVVTRHESLRASFAEVEGEPLQQLNDLTIELDVIDASSLNEADLQARITELAQQPFDLSAAPLLRIHLLKENEQSHVLMFVIHHIIADGWSLNLLFRDLMECYRCVCESDIPYLPELTVQYADFAGWQRDFLDGEALQAQLKHWRDHLEGAPALLELPTDRPRPSVQSYKGALQSRLLPADLHEQLNQLSIKQGSTLFMTLYAAFFVLMSRYSGQQDIVIGTPVAGRSRTEFENLIGFFLNNLVLRADLSDNPSFVTLLDQVKRITLEGYANQDLPFEKLVEELQPARDMSHAPLFQVMFTLQNIPDDAALFGGLVADNIEFDYGTAKYDITWSLIESSHGLHLTCEYAADLFADDTIRRMLEHYQVLLKSIVANPAAGINSLALLSGTEKSQLEAWNSTAATYPRDKALHTLFEEQAARTPDAIACEFGEQQFSYRELNARANGLAQKLIELGAGPDERVAICVHRNIDTLTGLLGILKSGAGYVPLDPIYPPERIGYMLEDSGAGILVSEPTLSELLPTDGITVVDLTAGITAVSDNPPARAAAGDLAYLIYTSGSTGLPKGVQIEHQAVVNFLHSMATKPGIHTGDRLLAVTTLCFDISILELFLPILNGATVVIATQEQTADGFALKEILEERNITMMQATPATWRLLQQAGWNGTEQLQVLVGGEALERDLAGQLHNGNAAVWNMYGPTETTIWSACHQFHPADPCITVGKPIANTQFYVLDDALQLTPAGVPGELWIGGDGVARGYWQREELTAERFIDNPFGGGRIYCTGDRVRWLGDGTLEVLGRTDFQVKLRGFRIELGEIESRLGDLPEITQSIVILREDTPGDQRLVAYSITPEGVHLDSDKLREHLQAGLPDYMVPSAFVTLERFPLTPNGKIDRKALPAPDREDVATAEYVAPRNKTEQQLATLWADILGIEQVGIHDDFFALGGHSLLAVKVTSGIRDTMDAEVSVLDLFTARSIAALAGVIETRKHSAATDAIPVVPRDGLLPLSFAQQRLWFLDELSPEDPMYNVPWMMRIHGSVNVGALESALNAVIARHESLRTVFPSKQGQATQLILNELHLPLEQIDLRGSDEDALQSKLTELAQTPFRLREGPLMRVTLLRTGDDSYALSLIVHHIIFDAWSHGVFLRELAAFYNAAVHGTSLQLPPLNIEFADYAAWQRSWFGSDDFNRQLDYWKNQLGDAPGVSEIHTDRPRPAVQTSNGANVFRFMPDDVHAGLKSIIRSEGCTLFSVLMAAFNVLVYRYSGQDDLVIGTPIAGRKRSELEDIIGFFLHTLAIRSDLSGNPQFNELLHRVNNSVLNGFEHQELPFETLVEELGVERDTSRSPIFQIMFVLQHVDIDWQMFDGLQTEPLNFEFGTAKYDIMFFVFETADGLAARVEYNTDLFDGSSMERLLEHFETLLSGIVANPQQAIEEIPLLKDREQHQLLVEWNQTAFEYPDHQTMHGLFEQQAALNPDNKALYFEGEELSYRELNRRANKLAQQLIEKGAGPDVLVGISIERCTEMIVGMLATLKAGAAYVPLDPAYPPQRVSYMLNDCKAPLLLTHSGLIEKLPECETQPICLDTLDWSVTEEHDRNPVTAVEAHNLGYTIYTSGSTGMPKGVAIEHRNAVALIQWAGQVFAPEEFSGVLASTSVCFDLSVFEIFCTLGLGGRIIVVKDALALPDLPEAANVTLINTVPSAIAELVRINGLPASVKTVNLAGEPLSTALVDAIYGLGTVERVNDLYGPSEDTTYSTWTLREAGKPPTIGRPIYNTQAYILDSHMNPVPIGVAGELYLGGKGVTRGYLGRPELTAEKYITDPFSDDPDARLYSTGDQARYRADSNIEFIGRVDHQVKLRGFRIELGEIESVLNSHSAVEQTVVMAREDRDGDKRLVAYLVGSTENLEGDELEQWEAEQVDQWKNLWENAYDRDEEVVDPTFNITGWDSSYDGNPIPPEEMRVWLDTTASRIKSLQPRKALEVGSGTGLIVASVAPDCESYLATDFSHAAIQTIEKLKAHLPKLSNVEGMQSPADGIGQLPKGAFDTVIINSVAQYFPDIDYLVSVIDSAIERIGEHGYIFLGDLRSRPLLGAYHASVQLFQAADDMPLPELAELIQLRTEQEEELLIDPALFLALQRDNPRVTGVRFALKRGTEQNELTRFRYDAILEIDGAQEAQPEPERLDWASAGLNLNELQSRFADIDSNGLLLTNIPDERLITESYCIEQLQHPGENDTAGLKAEAAEKIGTGIDPEQLYLMAEAAGLDLQIIGSTPGEFNALFRRAGKPAFNGSLLLQLRNVPVRDYGNDPLHGRLQRSLVPILKERLAEAVPEYMIPSAFVIMDAFPLTPNGKVNRKALPAPERSRDDDEPYVAPRNEAESKLADIWIDILGVTQVGIHDSFFNLGGHSLLATQMASRVRETFGTELPLLEVFNKPTIAGIAQAIGRSGAANQRTAITAGERPDELPPSFAQQRMWFLDQLDPGNPVYNMPWAMQINGSLQTDALQQALNEVVQRHEVLRTVFTENQGKPSQTILANPDIAIAHHAIAHHDCSDLIETETALNEQLNELAAFRFDLAHGPLLKADLIRTGNDSHVLMIVMHHICSDMWSSEILLRELAAYYDAIVAGNNAELEALPVQYADFAIWQQEWLETDDMQNQLAYWSDQLRGAPDLITLPTDRPRGATQSYEGAHTQRQFSASLTQQLHELAGKQDSTLFMVLMAAFNVLLSRYANQQDILIGTPVAGRQQTELESLIGLFVNTLVIRSDLSDNPGFEEFIQSVRQTSLEAFDNQNLPFEKIVDELQPSRDMSHAPLFQVIFVLQNQSWESEYFNDLDISNHQLDVRTAKVDLALSMQEIDGALLGHFEYNTALFDESTISGMLENFEILLNSIVAKPATPVMQLPMLNDAELKRQTVEWNPQTAPYSHDTTLHALIEQRVVERPDDIALLYGDTAISFAEMNRRINQLAHELIAQGAGRGTLVGIALDRTPEMVISILAVFKSGAAYLPLDPDYPDERLSWMLEDSGTGLIISRSDIINKLPENQAAAILLDSAALAESLATRSTENPGVEISAGDLAYIIYTSGSTGRPKGVMLRHEGAANLLLAQAHELQLSPDDRLLQFASISFDASVGEITMSLGVGATLVLAPKDELMPGAPLLETLRRQKITIVTLPPSALYQMQPEDLPGLRNITVAGEACPQEIVDRWAPGRRFINLYGPTENTVWATYDVCVPGVAPTLGRVIPNVEVFVLSEYQQPLPIGAAGELCLGGVALARGYLHRDDLTAEKFVAHPFKPGKRVYRTGDLVRFNNDGKLEFLGRIDHQVKVRGFRIELGEIETALTAHHQVEECLVIAHGDNLNDRELVAYLTPLKTSPDDKPELGELRRWLQQSLPDFMVPASFVMLDEFPLTPNGKIDRAALPAPDGAKLQVATEYVAPRNDTESTIAAIWSELLGAEQVGVHDNFFELGGHSLLATQLVARIRDSLQVSVQLREVFASPTVAELAQLIVAAGPDSAGSRIIHCDRNQAVPLSFAQQRLWFLDQLETANPVYNIPWAMRLKGSLDAQALQTAIEKLIARHEVLRTHFSTENGVARQVISDTGSCELEFIDMSGSDAAAINAKVVELGQTTFDLSRAPLLRTWLLRTGADEHVFVLNIHHIICDGWSMSVLYRELLALYREASSGQPADLQPLEIQYADFAAWQRDWMQSDELQQQIDYWSDKLKGAPALLNLPLDRPRGTEQSHDGAHIVEALPKELAERLEALAAEHDSTLFMVLLAAFNVLLSRYSNQNDILVGTPVAGRQRTELEALVGFFVNTLVIRSDLDDNPAFSELLGQVKQSSLEAFDNQDLPFEKLVDEVSPTRDMSHSPLFQVMFTFQNQPYSDARFDALEAGPMDVDFGAAKFDLTLSMGEFDGELLANFEYNTALFDKSTVQRMLGHFRNLLTAIAEAPDTAVGALPMLDEAEIRQQVVDWNPAKTPYADNSSIHALIEAQTQNAPDAIALRFGDETLSYADLDSRANQLAGYLLEQGAGRGTLIGLCLERSPDIVISILAVFKAGAAYVPLDPDYPADRLAHMLNDSGAGLLITQSHLLERLPENNARVIALDTARGDISRMSMQPNGSDVKPDDLAYIIYTSGSTGLPKGVMLQHQGACNLIHAQSSVFGLGPQDRMLQFASISFDASIFEILMGLGVGAELVMAGKDDLLPGTPLLNLLQTQQVTAVTLPPSALMQMQPTELPALRVITVAGEACPQELVDRWAENRRFFNLYGPTEATVWSTYEQCLPGRTPTIGKAVPNAEVYVLNDQLQPLPAGVAGELCLGGAGLARGYMNRAELTAEKFISNPYKAGERIYRTGDLVRFNADGALEFLGRIDHQVKVRGFRIELGEIETALAAHSQVRECVVLAHGESLENKQLLAYLVADGEQPSLGELRSWLQQSLPDFMVPASFVILDEFPLTPNGKIDRKALPDPDDSKLGVSTEYVAPRDHNELVLAEIWGDLLGAERVGIHDNFFELGGDSILSIQIIARASQKGLRLTAKQLFQNQTIAELATKLSADMPEISAEQGRVLGSIPLTPIQQWYLEKELAEPGHFNQSLRFSLTEEVNPVILEQALHLLTDHHDALRLRFKQTASGWQQEIAPFEDAQLLVKITDNDAKTLTRVQQRVSLKKGPLLKAALLQTGDTQELLIVVHHMAVDWVSWPVLLEDLELAYRKLDTAKPVSFPRKTTSFKAWSERLQDYARSAELCEEIDYWNNLPLDRARPLPVDHPAGSNAESFGNMLTVSLSEDETRQLLKLNAKPQEILLTAVGKAVADFTGSDTALFDLEGHGREDLFDDVSLSRTVGWFTSIYPVALRFDDASVQANLNRVKQQLQAIPNNGIGYGLLKYLNNDGAIDAANNVQAEVGFNYIGQADGVAASDSLFVASNGPRGDERSSNNERLHKLDINCLQSGGCLYLNFGYSSELFEEASIAALAEQATEVIRSLFNPAAGTERTAADFPLAGIDDDALAILMQGRNNVSDIYPLTPLQQGMLFHSVFDQKNDVYFASFNWLLEGALDTRLFREAWNFVINQHASLRSAVVWQGLPEPLQLVLDSAEIPFHVEDWSAFPEAEQNTRLTTLLDQDRSRSFDLTQAPLTRVSVVKLSETGYRMIWAFHHMMMDGWSVPLVIGQVFATYETLLSGDTPQPLATRPFRNYIEWLQEQDQAAAKQFWQDNLSGFRAPTPLPAATLTELPPDNSPDTQEVFLPLSIEQGNKLKSFAQQNRVTVNTVTQGVWALLLSRYSGEEDIVFGATTAGRPATLDGIETMVGLFLNTLPVRINTAADQTVADWLQNIQEQQLTIAQYEFASLIDIQGWSDVPRGKPLFDSLLAFENYPDIQSIGESKGSIEIKSSEGIDRTNFPLTLNVTMSDTLYLRFVYDRNLFASEVIETLSEHMATMLGHIADMAARPLSDIPMLTSAEARQLESWNATARDYPADVTLASLLSLQAAKTPDAPAVTYAGRTLSYKELDERSNQLAHYLRSRGIGTESLVGVALERSAELVIALHAVVKAGAAYVPMDPEYPEQRLQHMAEDAALSMLLTHSRLSDVLADADIQRIHIDIVQEELRRQPATAPDIEIRPDQAAYVIFTSGSTGRPKGVLNEHRGICNRLLWMQEEYQLDSSDRVLQKTPFSFDVSVWEFFWPLMTGAELVVAKPGGHKDSSYLAALIKEHNITTLHFVPSMLAVFLQDQAAQGCDSLRRVICSGEALPYDLQTRFYALNNSAGLHNLYGPTEAAIDVTYWPCPRDGSERTVPIGRAVANTRLYVVDQAGHQLPVGVPGELWISGVQVARGYVNRPELTAERFIDDPFFADNRIYKTGDLVRYRNDGAIEFLGRIDHQVKLRGFRIELGEIESVLMELSGVEQATVLLREDAPGLQQLVGYVVAESGFDTEAAAQSIGEQLPDYMVPSAWVVLDEMPLSPNGKVDRGALPAPELAQTAVEYVAPRDELESGLATIWQELLEVDQVGINDDFFALGGHSLIAMRVVTRARDELNVEIPLDAVFTAPNIAALAETVKHSRDSQGDTAKNEPTIKKVDRASRRTRRKK